MRKESKNNAQRNTGDHNGSVDESVSSAYFQGFSVTDQEMDDRQNVAKEHHIVRIHVYTSSISLYYITFSESKDYDFF